MNVADLIDQFRLTRTYENTSSRHYIRIEYWYNHDAYTKFDERENHINVYRCPVKSESASLRDQLKWFLFKYDKIVFLLIQLFSAAHSYLNPNGFLSLCILLPYLSLQVISQPILRIIDHNNKQWSKKDVREHWSFHDRSAYFPQKIFDLFSWLQRSAFWSINPQN